MIICQGANKALINFQPKDIIAFTKEVDACSGKMTAAVERFKKAGKIVDSKRKDDSQQAFLRFHAHWRKGVAINSEAMKRQ